MFLRVVAVLLSPVFRINYKRQPFARNTNSATLLSLTTTTLTSNTANVTTAVEFRRRDSADGGLHCRLHYR